MKREERVRKPTHSLAQTARRCQYRPSALYHVTHPDNIESIVNFGVSPEFSQSHPDRIYCCERRSLFWAIRHIAKRHGWQPENLVIFRIRTGKSTRPLGNGLWFDTRPKSAHYYDDAVYHLRL